MSVISSYVAVIMIWATTPLAIKISNHSLTPFAAVTARMVLALAILMLLVKCLKPGSDLKRAHWRIYAAGGAGIFPNMLLVYMAADYITSGMIAVMFSLSTIATSVIAAIVLRENSLTPQKLFGVLLAISGLGIIFYRQLHLGDEAIYGLLLMLSSIVIFSLSQVAVKRFQQQIKIDPFEQTYGALSFSTPGLLLSWGLFDGQMPTAVSNDTLIAVVYLALIGSLLGFIAYYYILTYLSVTVVSLIPLITPALALWLGAMVLDETVGWALQAGSVLILLGLAVYDGVFLSKIKRFALARFV